MDENGKYTHRKQITQFIIVAFLLIMLNTQKPIYQIVQFNESNNKKKKKTIISLECRFVHIVLFKQATLVGEIYVIL